MWGYLQRVPENQNSESFCASLMTVIKTATSKAVAEMSHLLLNGIIRLYLDSSI
jgi:hypothetical protein